MKLMDQSTQPADRRTDSEDARVPLIRKAGVLGAGTMGSRIAALFANAGIPVVLLDLASSDDEQDRSRIARQSIERLLQLKPAALYQPSFSRLITPANFDDDLGLLTGCDWIVEAVSENLAIKQALLSRVLPFLSPHAIVTTNTSGLPVASIASGLPEEFRTRGFHKRFFGTHFFNPPRYMRLMELVPTLDSDPEVMDSISQFADRRFGKVVVRANDTPNFIANRVGVFTMFTSIELMQQQGNTVEEVDTLTGTILGWPRTGTFRLADMVGIDVLINVAQNFARSQTGAPLEIPGFLSVMLERKWIGDKVGQGFYKKSKDAVGGELRLALDLNTLEYRPLQKAKFASIEMARNAEPLEARLKLLMSADPAKDKAAAFYVPLLTRLWNYAADLIGEAADDTPSIDQAMRAGFNWQLGPFEMWDAVGVADSVQRMRAAGARISPNVDNLIALGNSSWYREEERGRSYFDLAAEAWHPIHQPAGIAGVADFRKRNGVVRRNAGASLIDIGDDIACIELHSLKDAVGSDVVSFVTKTLSPNGEAVRNFRGFVIGGDRENFSVGANLLQLLLAMQEEDWEELDLAIRAFQKMTAAIKFCPRPVVVAPFRLCLGGGAEMCLHAAARTPHAELYMGLVEAGVGLIPGGGGTKEMALRAIDVATSINSPSQKDPPSKLASSAELLDALKHTLEIIAMAKVSTSAHEARDLGLLAPSDRITANRERLLLDAREVARALADAGYAAPVTRNDIPAAGEAVLPTLKLGIHLMRQAEYISDHDVKVAAKAAHILCGGNLTPGTLVSEKYLLDLEREAFLSLCGERKTQERIAFTLKTGKPLRN
jgi:3-hydroxyacyl-CoA dehydrogenase